MGYLIIGIIVFLIGVYIGAKHIGGRMALYNLAKAYHREMSKRSGLGE